MVQEAIEPFVRMLSMDAGSADASGDVASVVDAHMRTAAANPWVASLIVNEVLPEGGKLRAAFVRNIGSRLLPGLVELIEKARRAGKLREDIDARLTALSIVSLNVFPFISRPITGTALGLKLEGAELERLIAHTTSLLLHGIAAPQKSPPRVPPRSRG